jgi:hypothetical protein
MTKAPSLDNEAVWKTLKVLSDEASSLRAVVEQSEKHGLFRYSIERYFGPAEEDEGQWPEGFWQSILRSGLYDSIVQTTNEARASLDQAETAKGA